MNAHMERLAIWGGLALAVLLAGCRGLEVPLPLQAEVDVGAVSINSPDPEGNVPTTAGRAQGYVFRSRSRLVFLLHGSPEEAQPPDEEPAVGATVTLGSPVAAGAGALQLRITRTDENGYFFFDFLPGGVTYTVDVTDEEGTTPLNDAPLPTPTAEFSILGFFAQRVDLSGVYARTPDWTRVRSIDAIRIAGDFENQANEPIRLRILSSNRADLTAANVEAEGNLNFSLDLPASSSRTIAQDITNLDLLKDEVLPTDEDQQFFFYFLVDVVGEPSSATLVVEGFSVTVRGVIGVGL